MQSCDNHTNQQQGDVVEIHLPPFPATAALSLENYIVVIFLSRTWSACTAQHQVVALMGQVEACREPKSVTKINRDSSRSFVLTIFKSSASKIVSLITLHQATVAQDKQHIACIPTCLSAEGKRLESHHHMLLSAKFRNNFHMNEEESERKRNP